MPYSQLRHKVIVDILLQGPSALSLEYSVSFTFVLGTVGAHYGLEADRNILFMSMS